MRHRLSLESLEDLLARDTQQQILLFQQQFLLCSPSPPSHQWDALPDLYRSDYVGVAAGGESHQDMAGTKMAEASSIEKETSATVHLEQSTPLTTDLWRIILQKLPLPSLARASCVCRLWHSIAGDPVVLSNRFKEAWKLLEVVGSPLSASFWRDGSLGRFAISHTVKRWDTVAGLAVKYQVHVIEIKRLNNMISDHGIHSRERLLIPVSQPEILEGRTCYIEVDPYAKREVAILYLDDEMPVWSTSLDQVKQKSQERFRRGVLESMKRSLQVDDGTAQYYLSLAGGDLRAAYSQFNEDLRWEESARTRRMFPCLS